MKYQLIMGSSEKKGFIPAVEEGVTLTLKRRSTPGKLEFSLIKDSALNFVEGSPVGLKVDGVPIFSGFVFKKKSDKDSLMSVTAYDQLRYLKNKDSYLYKGKTASQFIQMIADDFKLKTGTIEDTGFVIARRREDNTSLFDMVENALDLTLTNAKKMFVLYDDYGKLALKNIENMKISGYIIYNESAENFEYTSSIDEQTYNQIKLSYDNDDTGKREIYITKDSSNIQKWGVLQYYDTLTKKENGKAKADALLKLYNQVTKKLKITGTFGNPNVRPGCLIPTLLDLGDVKLQNYMMVEEVTHHLYLDEHSMDLTLVGGGFIA